MVPALATSLPASPLLHPKRLLSVYTVDLAPLFKWWAKHEGPRPLTSWVHVTGTVVGTNAMGWIIEGQVEPSARGRDEQKQSDRAEKESRKIILRTPPVEDLVEFEQLSSQLNALTLQRTSLVDEASDAKNREQAVAQQEHAARRNGSRAQILQLEDHRLKQAEKDAKTQQKPLDQQIKDLTAKLAVYPNKDHYVLDCFALDLQQDYQQMPLYEHGQVVK